MILVWDVSFCTVGSENSGRESSVCCCLGPPWRLRHRSTSEGSSRLARRVPPPHPLPPASTTPTNRDPVMMPHFVFPTSSRCRKLAAWGRLQVALSGRALPRPECLRARAALAHLDAPQMDAIAAEAPVAVRRTRGRRIPSIEPRSARGWLQRLMLRMVHDNELDEPPPQPRPGASAPTLIPVL
jgi:hypothetical protein